MVCTTSGTSSQARNGMRSLGTTISEHGSIGRHKEVIAGACPRRGVHFKRDALATRNSKNRPTKLNRGSVFFI